jgi:hypothetical protein
MEDQAAASEGHGRSVGRLHHRDRIVPTIEGHDEHLAMLRIGLVVCLLGMEEDDFDRLAGRIGEGSGRHLPRRGQ